MSARFVLKFKLKGRPNRDRPDVTRETRRVVLGSRPLADIYVKDRLVSQEAIAFDYDGSRLQVEVLGSLSGVFVDGSPVEGVGRIGNGSTVHVGHTFVEVAVDPATSTCTLTTSELYLPSFVDGVVKRAKVDPPFALGDSGPQEHRWGRNPLLRRANWGAVALGAIVLLAFPFLGESELLSRGELARAHQPHATPESPGTCSDCHAPFSSDYAPRCAKCHEGYAVPELHPFGLAAETSCSECHADHAGADSDLLPASAREVDPKTGWKRMCLQCHGVMEPGQKERKVRDEPGVPTQRWLHVDGFSHGDHRIVDGRSRLAAVPVAPSPEAGQVPIACAKCHTPISAGGEASPIASSDFALVTYERCLDCHADWKVEVHGRDDGGVACYVCHAPAATPADITKALRQVELPALGGKWSVAPRAHDFAKEDCTRCHVEPRTAGQATGARIEAVFRHDHHLPGIDVPAGTGLVYSQACVPCHASVAGSDSLAGVALVDTSGCTDCHTGEAPQPVAAGGAPKRRVNDMFHRLHAIDPATLAQGATRTFAQREKLATGCIACHVPVAGEAQMGYRDGALDCSACHQRHANVGQGRCVLCHVDRQFAGNRRPDGRIDFVYQEEGIFDRAKAVTKTTAAIAKFDHFSRGHVDSGCEDCHDTAKVDAAERVLDVAWPAVDEASCVKCHALERYHR